MRLAPRLFASSLTSTERLVYGAVTLLFVVGFFAVIWPVYRLFSRIRPLVLGMPFSLAYLIFMVLLCFGAMLALYLWEDRTGRLE